MDAKGKGNGDAGKKGGGNKRPFEGNPHSARAKRQAKQMMHVPKLATAENGGTSIARVLNVEEFVETRAFEIQSMEKALRNAT
ncbi:hypothetical protein HDU67_001089 [Dinochytrium kinnereticum]|nr:hypothetical protein HDU67_001089 [Dinochytrium kinnereticum]